MNRIHGAITWFLGLYGVDLKSKKLEPTPFELSLEQVSEVVFQNAVPTSAQEALPPTRSRVRS